METNEPKITLEECMKALKYYTEHSDFLITLGQYNTARIKELCKENEIKFNYCKFEKFEEIKDLDKPKTLYLVSVNPNDNHNTYYVSAINFEEAVSKTLSFVNKVGNQELKIVNTHVMSEPYDSSSEKFEKNSSYFIY